MILWLEYARRLLYSLRLGLTLSMLPMVLRVILQSLAGILLLNAQLTTLRYFFSQKDLWAILPCSCNGGGGGEQKLLVLPCTVLFQYSICKSKDIQRRKLSGYLQRILSGQVCEIKEKAHRL
jgi:hypothetical protein